MMSDAATSSTVDIPARQAAPPGGALDQGEVHVWQVDLDQPPGALPWDILSEDERRTARRFHFDRDRDRYVACRSALRRILSHYLRTPPKDLPIAYGPHGKPQLSGNEINFNLSHSQDVAVIALSANFQIGIDFEKFNPTLDHEALAQRFFTAPERAYIATLPPDRRREGFYQCWTRKEAWMKALGHGLMQPLENFDVSISLPASSATLRSPNGAWSVIELRPASDCVAALVTDAPPRRLTFLKPRFDPPAATT